MDLYHIVLFVHIVTLIVATGVTAVVKLALGRRIKARTVAEAIEWHDFVMSVTRLFPVCLVSFLATGVYMLRAAGGNSWSLGYVNAGFAGVLLLFASGAYLGMQGAGFKRVLAEAGARGMDAPPPRVVPPLAVMVLPSVNTGLALGVVFDMVTKPASVGVALAIVAFGAVAAGMMSMRKRVPAMPMGPEGSVPLGA